MLVDIAVPRAIDPKVAEVADAHLVGIDSLRELAADPLTREQVARVEAVISGELSGLAVQLKELALRPLIASLWKRAEQSRAEVLRRTRSRVPQLDDDSWRHIENMAAALVRKLLHAPATRLRAEASNGHAQDYASVLGYLFGLDSSGGDPP